MLDKDADIAFPNTSKQLILECYLCPKKNFELKLTQSNSLKDDLILGLNWKAKVNISTEQKSYSLLNILNMDQKTKYVFNYGTADKVPIDYKGDYLLSIKTQAGGLIKGIAQSLSFVPIEDAHLKENKLIVSFNIPKTDKSRCYMVIAEGVYKNDSRNVSEEVCFKESEVGNVSISLMGSMYKWSKLKVKLLHISKEYFDFKKSVHQAYSANIDPFTVPAKIKSNVDGGIGIFTYYAIDSLRLK